MVYELVKIHGGTVTVTSELNKGTTFTVTIPMGSSHLPPEQVKKISKKRMSLDIYTQSAGFQLSYNIT